MPTRLASRTPQAFKTDHRFTKLSRTLAAAPAGRMPGMVQAGTYSSVMYLKAMQATGTTEGAAVAAQMHALRVDDFFAKGRVREDGRLAPSWRQSMGARTTLKERPKVRLRSHVASHNEEGRDQDAVVIGSLYRKGRAAILDGLKYYLKAGRKLIQKKASMPHGEWVPWLRANADALGLSIERPHRG